MLANCVHIAVTVNFMLPDYHIELNSVLISPLKKILDKTLSSIVVHVSILRACGEFVSLSLSSVAIHCSKNSWRRNCVSECLTTL